MYIVVVRQDCYFHCVNVMGNQLIGMIDEWNIKKILIPRRELTQGRVEISGMPPVPPFTNMGITNWLTYVWISWKSYPTSQRNVSPIWSMAWKCTKLVAFVVLKQGILYGTSIKQTGVINYFLRPIFRDISYIRRSPPDPRAFPVAWQNAWTQLSVGAYLRNHNDRYDHH